ncbi:hypothetical protein DY000_02027185 [Brassica cretica]|uniref:Uncharacterized protein n=1 Tax=Brassica cretica TaxID=69181 RepID=A0ABQ7E837_BRACR|nr:hypothetical protein DY000_02027185 [Brassica cretica]
MVEERFGSTCASERAGGRLQVPSTSSDETVASREEANDEAQEEAEMEADFMAQLGGDEAHEEAEVQDVSSTAPQPAQVLRRSTRLASLLFG